MSKATRAASFAWSSDCNYKVGALLVCENSTTGGWNKRKTHPLQDKWAKRAKQPNKQYLHAEIMALARCAALGDTPEEITVVRVKKDGSYGIARPCPICMLALLEAGVRTVHFSNSAGEMVTEYI